MKTEALTFKLSAVQPSDGHKRWNIIGKYKAVLGYVQWSVQHKGYSLMSATGWSVAPDQLRQVADFIEAQ